MPGIAPTDGSHAAAGLQNQLPLKVAIAYSRVSTSRQSSEIKSGFDRQQEGIDRWAAAHPDYEIEQTVRHIGSGAKGGRFDWFITALEKETLPRGTCLVVDDLSRFSRERMTDVLETLIKVFRAGGAIAVCSLGGEVLENLDNQQGQIFMIAGAITSARAEWEMKQARTKAAVEKRRQAIREGNYVPAPRTDSRTSVDFPFWIDVDEDGQFVLNEHAAMVKRCFALGASGLGSTRIARALNEEGFRSIRDPKKAWTGYAVRKSVLHNRGALGFKPFVSGGKVIEEVLLYPPVVTQAVWDEVQAAIKSRAPSMPASNSPKVQNLFQGAVWCRCCGSPMSLRKQGSGYGYLRCREVYGKCGNVGFRYSDQGLLELLLRFRWEKYFDSDRQEADLGAATKAVIDAEAELRGIEIKIDNLTESIVSAGASGERSTRVLLWEKALEAEDANKRLAQQAVDKAINQKLALERRPNGREAERRLRQQIEGFLTEEQSVEARQTFNSWFRSEGLGIVIGPDRQPRIGTPIVVKNRLVGINCSLDELPSDAGPGMRALTMSIQQRFFEDLQTNTNEADLFAELEERVSNNQGVIVVGVEESFNKAGEAAPLPEPRRKRGRPAKRKRST